MIGKLGIQLSGDRLQRVVRGLLRRDSVRGPRVAEYDPVRQRGQRLWSVL
jgi:hypothetical protein